MGLRVGVVVAIAVSWLAVDSAYPTVASASGPSHAKPAFVLEPTWLPTGFSASGGGYVKPPGGLKVGNEAGASVSILSVGPESTTRPDPVLFTLSYFGYHNPESKSIRLTALQSGVALSGGLKTLGGRHVALSSQFVPGYFGGNTDSNASWVEHGVYMQVSAQGISEAQLARFVTGLKEHSPPHGS